jgi:hypothetical protein
MLVVIGLPPKDERTLVGSLERLGLTLSLVLTCLRAWAVGLGVVFGLSGHSLE